MADLAKVSEAMAAPTVRKYRGHVVTVGGRTCVSVAGRVLEATWADPLVVKDGDFVNVEISSGPTGQAVAHVASRTALQPRPRTGRVTAVPSGASVMVSAGGRTYQAEFVGSYAVNDTVHLDWGAGRPRVIGKVSTMSVNPSREEFAALPQAVGKGQTNLAAVGSGTFVPGKGWNVHAGGGEGVFQGTWDGDTCYGAWFYGRGLATLRKKRLTRIIFKTAFRRFVGEYGDPAVFHFYAHTSGYRPTGDVTRAAGPFDYEVAPADFGHEIDLPPEMFGPVLLAGGGIAIAGEPYAAMDGRLDTPDSGALIVEWENL